LLENQGVAQNQNPDYLCTTTEHDVDFGRENTPAKRISAT
jgi:hypothetical protein